MIVQPKTITIQEKKLLVAALSEMKARGMKMPANFSMPMTRNDLSWGMNENGYFNKVDGSPYKPTDAQAKFIHDNARFSLFRGARGAGKTVAGAQKALLRVMAGESGMVVNPDLENFRLSTWQELRLWIPWSMVIPKQRYRKSEGWDVTRPFTMVFMNGAKMFCKGLKDPESARGSNVNWLWYDEGARDRTGLGWRIANFAVRVGDAPQSWITTTPKGSAHWLYDFFEKKEIPAEVWKIVEEIEAKSGIKRELISSYHGTVRDNKENLDEMTYASYIMSAPSGYLRAQEVEGEYANEEGSLGDRKWFDNKVLPAVPDWISKQVRFWDLAATEKKMTPGKKNDPDETLGTLLGTDSETTKEVKRFCILDQKGGRWKWEQIERMVVEVAREDGSEVEICFEQEPASGGINQIEALKQHIQKELPYHHVSSLLAKKLGDRVLAANPWFGEAANGQFYMVKGLWNEDFLSQLDVFPNVAVHDDKVTSVTGARHKIAPIKKWSKVSFMAVSTPEKREN